MPDPLDEKDIRARAASYCNVLDVIVQPTVGSTNDWCLQQCKSGRALPFACFAEEQTSGKGRRGKRWITAPGSNIAMSLSWSFTISHLPMQLLSFAIAIAVVNTLSAFRLKHIAIKWPNDVYIHDRKIAGILIETLTSGKGDDGEVESAAVIGVGLNVDMPDEYIASTSVTLTDITQELKSLSMDAANRQDVASLLLQNIVSACEKFSSNYLSVLDEFRDRYDYCKNKTVEILLDNQETLSGVAMGVNDAAELLVMVDGKVRAFNSAEVSVKT